MRQRRLLAYGALGATLATLLVGVQPVAAQPTAAPPAAAATPPGEAPATRRLTLITGDQVTVSGKEVAVTPRKGVHFVRLQRDKSDYVIPSDAIPLLKADRLDDRLFNVTALLEFGFDKLSHLPLVVSDAAAVRGLSTGPELAAVDGFATKVPIADLAKTWQTTRTSVSSGKIWADGVRQSKLDTSVPMIGAPTAWSAGYDGTGVKVAVLDSGIDDTHPDLAGKVVARRNFIPETETALDLNGHGTHVSSTIVGSGAASDGKYKGVAPGATLLDGKVCWNVEGRGSCSDSAILAAMQWAAEAGASIVNMSLGGQDSFGVDPLEQAVNDLTAEYGTLFVVAAGNYNGWQFRVGSPSTADAALSVANFDKAGELNWSSLQGPRIGDFGVKPDIGGPGTEITAARSPSALGHLPVGPYFAATGTSMAAPHVAGAAALLAQAHPGWKATQLKEALMATASPNPAYDVFAQGAGFVDVTKALSQPVTVSPPSLSLGVLEWPHTEAPTARTMTYHNRGDQPVTLDLALAGDAPAGLLTLSASTLTVPAGGDATVQVTIDERASTSYGLYKGRLVATGGGDVKVQTPFSVYHEEPAAGLKISALGRDGKAPGTVLVELVNPDPQNYASHTFYTSSASIRVPLNSSWRLSAYIENPDGTMALLTNNRIVADADQEIVLDARRARPLDITVADTGATSYDASVMVLRSGDPIRTYAAVSGELDDILTADVGPTGLAGVSTQVHAVFQGPARRDRAPDIYQLGWRIKGSFINGLVKQVSRRDLATVQAEYAQNASGVSAWRTNSAPDPDLADGGLVLISELPKVATPARRTEYYNDDVTWWSKVYEKTTEGNLWILDLAHPQEAAYRAGGEYTERWNGAVLNTALTPQAGSPAVARDGNTIRAAFTGYTDGAGHVGLPYSMNNHQLTLHKDDTLVGEFNYLYGTWEVAAEPTTYRMRYALDLPEPYRLSRRTETEWTFTTSAAQPGALPLTSIGFRPALALDNSVRAGSSLTIPLTFAQQATAGRVTSANVSVSFDDGRTWTTVRTDADRGSYAAKVRHPKGTSGFVSLRATAVDSAGNTVTTTVYRAYEVK